jgi:hypothetical protein
MYASDSGAKRDRRDGDVERWRTDKRGCEAVGTYSYVFGILVMTVGLALGTGASIGCGYAAKQHKHDY